MKPLHELSLKEAITEIWIILTWRTATLYVLGMLSIGVGVGLMLRSNVGVSSWDTLNYSLTELIPSTLITMGVASGITATVMMMITIYLYRNWVYLVMAIPIVIVSSFIVFFNEVVYDGLEFTTIPTQILAYTAGLLMLPLGGSLMIVTKLPAGVYDEFMLAVLKTVKSSNITVVRAIIEITVVLLALVLSSIAGVGTGQINIGTLIFSLTIGLLITIYLKLFEKIGLSDGTQTEVDELSENQVSNTNY